MKDRLLNFLMNNSKHFLKRYLMSKKRTQTTLKIRKCNEQNDYLTETETMKKNQTEIL